MLTPLPPCGVMTADDMKDRIDSSTALISDPVKGNDALKAAIDSNLVSNNSFNTKVSSSIFKANQSEINDVLLPSPYDAPTFAELSAKVQAELTEDGEVATWQALTADQKKTSLHPSLVYVSGGFCGYKYFCAYTPYPASNSYFENPCFAASNDLVNWEVPEGLENPLTRSPSAGYNRDTHLYFDEKGKRLVLIYLARTTSPAKNTLICKVSYDCVNWSEDFTIWQGDRGVNDYASPSIYFDAGINKWVMYGHDLDGGRDIIRKTSDDLLVDWGDSTNQVCNIPANAGFDWWHSQFDRSSDGKVVAAIQQNASVGSSGLVYSAISSDGINFEKSIKPIVKLTAQYRASFCASESGGLTLLTGGLNNTSLKLLSGELSPSPTKSELLLKAKGDKGVSDDFDRADASEVGLSSSGKTWQQYSATDKISISNFRATNSTSSNCRATLDAGSESCQITVKSGAIGDQMNIMFRFSDANNFWRFKCADSRLQQIAGGAIATDLSASIDVKSNSVITLKVREREVSVFIDGGIANRFELPPSTGETLCGLQMSGATPSFVDYFVVEDL